MEFLIVLLVILSFALTCLNAYSKGKKVQRSQQRTQIYSSSDPRTPDRQISAYQRRAVISDYNRGRFQMQQEYVVVDVETSGLDPAISDVVQIAAVKYKKGEEPSYFVSYVKPRYPIPVSASKVNHIYDRTVENAPRFWEIRSRFLTFIGDLPLVGYNIGFDMKFINTELGYSLPNWAIDVLPAARNCFVLPDYKLETLKNHLKIERGSHNALDDCLTTNSVYLACLEEYSKPAERVKTKLLKSEEYTRGALRCAIPSARYSEIYEKVKSILQEAGKDIETLNCYESGDHTQFRVRVGYDVVVLFRFTVKLSYCLVHMGREAFEDAYSGLSTSKPSQEEGSSDEWVRISYTDISLLDTIKDAICLSYDVARSYYL